MRKLLATCLLFLATPAGAQTFTNVTEDSGIAAVRRMRSAGWWMSGIQLVDFDGDGDLDYFMGAHGGGGIAALNDGRGHFTALPDAPWSATEIHVVYDLNEDGKLDVVVTEADGGGRWFLNQSTPGMPAFMKMNLSDEQSRTQNVIDLNRDGKADWFVADDAPRGLPYKIRLYLGNGTGGLGAATPQMWMTGMPLPFDADGDGDIDVIGLVGNPPSSPDVPIATRLYRNDGTMTFKDVTTEAGLDRPGLFILGAVDTDHDGDTDLIAMESGAFPLVVYVNNGAGIFARKADAIAMPASGRAVFGNIGLATITDVDNDGVGDVLAGGVGWFHVLRGKGDGTFQLANQTWGGIVNAGNLPDSAFAFGDIDGDGDLDIIGYRTASSSDRTPNVYRNDLPKQNWVKVRPVGVAGNRGASGAKIRVYEPGTGKLLWYDEVMFRAKQVQQNYYSLGDTERHFGLGARTRVDVAVLFYPSNKLVRQNDVPANSVVRVLESGMGMIVVPPVVAPTVDGGPARVVDAGSPAGKGDGAAGGAGGAAGGGAGGAGGAAASNPGAGGGGGGATGGAAGPAATMGRAADGCSCRAPGRGRTRNWPVAAALFLALIRRVRRTSRRRD